MEFNFRIKQHRCNPPAGYDSAKLCHPMLMKYFTPATKMEVERICKATWPCKWIPGGRVPPAPNFGQPRQDSNGALPYTPAPTPFYSKGATQQFLGGPQYRIY